jgi:sugar/nucleoside kinase (ribokinase family)
MALAAEILAAGAGALIVTMGPRGAVYVSAGGWVGGTHRPADLPSSRPITTALIPAEIVPDPADPTGCGDVFGGAVFARLLAGDSLPEAIAAGNRAGARNVSYRGATGLARHLRGELVAP